MEGAEEDGVVAAALTESLTQEQRLLSDGHAAPNLGDGAGPGAWGPTPPREAERLDAWARQGMQLWRSDDVVNAVRVIASDTTAPRDLQAMALVWTLPVVEDEESWSAARTLVNDPAIDRVTRVRLAAVLARELAARDDREAAGALDDVGHLALGADGDPRIEVAAARARVEIAAHGMDAGRIREAVDSLVAAAGADALPEWVRDGALASAVRGLRRCAEMDASALAHDQVAGVIAAVRKGVAGRRPPAAAAALILLDAAALGLADDRADGALSLVVEAANCGGDEAPPGFRFAAALLASDATAAAKGPAEALVHQRRAIAIAHELDTDHPKAVAHRGMGFLLARLDRPDDADTHLSRAADLFIAAGDVMAGAEVSLVRARELLIDDEVEPARRAAQTAITAVEPAATRDPRGDPTAGAAALLCDARAFLSEVDDLDGDHPTAAAGWLKAADAAVAAGRCGADHRSAAARSFAWAGQHERARRIFERAVHEAEQLDGSDPERARCLGTVLERRAMWHHEAGRTRQAGDDAREAVASYGLAGHATASAQAGLVLGRAHEAAGEPLAAEAAWRSALAAASTDTGPESRAVACAVHAALASLLTALGREADAAQHRRLSVASADDEAGTRDAAADADAAAKLEAARAGARRAESAVHPDTDPALLAALAADPLAPVRAAVATRPDLPTPLARRLARDGDPSVTVAIAGNPTAPRHAIRRAARLWASADVRRAAAGNPRAGRGLCTWFALSGRWDIRRAVAANPACPKWLLAGWLALDRTWSVREAVAASSRTPTFVLELYGRSGLAPLRLALAGNPAVPAGTAERLLHDRDVYVSGVAAGHPSLRARALSARFAEMESPAWMLRRVANNPRCPPELAEQVLTWLALDGARGDPEFDPVTCEGHPGDIDQNPWQWYGAEASRTERPWRHPLWAVRVRSAIGRDTMPTKVLRQLARDPVAQVRRVVLGYTRLGQPLYHELAGDADRVIRDAAPRMHERDRTIVRLPGVLGVVQRYRSLRAIVPLTIWILALALSPARDEPADTDADTAIASLPEFTVDSDGHVRFAPDAVMPVAPRVELNGGGTVTVGRELAHPRALIVRVETGESPIVIHSISWDSAVAESPESSVRVLRTVVPPFESFDVSVPGRPSTVEVEMTADGQRETHHFDLGSVAPRPEVAP